MKHVDNPPNPWSRYDVDWLGEPPEAPLQVYEERAKSILSKNDSPDVPFRWSVNPYRGCLHGCSYCYARPTHQYLDFGAGTDFERKIIAKVNAPELLKAALARKSWAGEAITFSGVTDCYQPLEATYGLTRACLEVCLAYENPVGIITKGSLIRRDIELLAKLHERAGVWVYVSIPFADDALRRAVEPQASAIEQRFKTLRLLAEAGIPTGVALAPVIPGLNDSAIAEILERAREAGARHTFMTMLRLPAEVADVFEDRLRKEFPQRADRVLNAIRDMRGGELNDARFGARFKGRGPRWEAIESLFKMHSKRLGFVAVTEPNVSQPGPKKIQLDLF
jgi:DNA repair photolyase